MSQHSHPRSQRGSIAKSPSCHEEEQQAVEQERPAESALDELQRQVEEELRNSDQVLSRIGSKYSRTRSPPAAERSYHETFVDNPQLNEFQPVPRSPVSNRSRRETLGANAGGVVFPPNENLVNDPTTETTEYMRLPTEETCEIDNKYYTSTDNYNSAVEESPADNDPSDTYAPRSPAANASAFHTSLDRIQSQGMRSGNESQHRNISGQSGIINDSNVRGPSTVLGSSGRGSGGRGSAVMSSVGRNSADVGATVGSANRSYVGRSPSSRMGCSESNCPERISQGYETSARSPTRSGLVEPPGQHSQSQYLTDYNNAQSGDKVYLNLVEEQIQGTPSSMADPEPQLCSAPSSPRAGAGSQLYQRDPSSLAESRGQSCPTGSSPHSGAGSQLYQRDPSSLAESRGQSCPTGSSPHSGAGSQLYQRDPSSLAESRGQSCPTGSSPHSGAGSQLYQRDPSSLAESRGQSCPTGSSPHSGAGSQLYQRDPSSLAESRGQSCPTGSSPHSGAGSQLYQRDPSSLAESRGQSCPTGSSPHSGAGSQLYQRGTSPQAGYENRMYQRSQSPVMEAGSQPCSTASSPRAGAGSQSYQRAPSSGAGVWDNYYSRMPCPEAKEADKAYQRSLNPIPGALDHSYSRPQNLEATYGNQPCQRPPSPGAGTVGQPYQTAGTGGQHCQTARSPRAGVGFQSYQKALSPPYGGQPHPRSPNLAAEAGSQPCEAVPNSARGAGGTFYQGPVSTPEPWDSFYSHPQGPRVEAIVQPYQRVPSPVVEAGGQQCPGARAAGQHYQRTPSPMAGAGGQSYQRAQSPVGRTGGQQYQKVQIPIEAGGVHFHHKEPSMGLGQLNVPERPEQIEAHHHDHHERGHPPDEQKTKILCRLSQIRKTPSLVSCEIDKGLEFLNVCHPKPKTGKVVKIPEKPCLKKHEIERLVKCEARDVDDALMVSANVHLSHKKPCPKQQKAQMSVQALVQAHAKQVCQTKTYTPLEHPDLEDISPELAADMMFSQELGLKMEECPYDIVTHLYPEEPQAPFPRKSRQSNVSVVDSQKEQEEIIEKSASVPSDGVSDSAYSRKMKERGEDMEARSSYDVELVIGQPKRQYVLVTQKPERINKIQFRGANSPLWFPGYFTAFPDEQGINLVPSPSEVFQRAWVHSNPKNMPTNDVIVLD